MTHIIETHTNMTTGCTAFVTKHAKGYAVSLRDDDSMEFLSTVVIFDTLEKASACAMKVLKN